MNENVLMAFRLLIVVLVYTSLHNKLSDISASQVRVFEPEIISLFFLVLREMCEFEYRQ